MLRNFLVKYKLQLDRYQALVIDMTEQKYNAADLTPFITSPRESDAALSQIVFKLDPSNLSLAPQLVRSG